MIETFIHFIDRWLGALPEVFGLFLAVLTTVSLAALLWNRLARSGGLVCGTVIGGPLVILVSVSAVLSVGLMTPQAMVGDEVTHFYMLDTQAQDLSKPNFFAHIPTGDGSIEIRRYPHSFLWHYIGAGFYYLTGRIFTTVQVYHTLFFAQLLVVAYLLARSRGGVQSRSALVYVVTIASLPICLLLSVTFYQDVPMAAQVLTAFYLLDRRRWLLASLFMAFAIGLKVTAILFFPAFFLLLAFRLYRFSGFKKGLLIFVCSTVLVLGFTWVLGKTINSYAKASFYPQEQLEIIVYGIKDRLSNYVNNRNQSNTDEQTVSQIPQSGFTEKTRETTPVIIANHPGDLRIKENYLIYAGIVFWIVLGGGLLGVCCPPGRSIQAGRKNSGLWLWLTGGSYLLLTAYLSRTSPDARFFLPGLVFILLPLAEKFVRLPKTRLLIILLVSIALLQGGYVLAKTYQLRLIPPAVTKTIAFLRENPPEPARVFMYPEGNYRLFPIPHEWYLGYRLRDFWRGSNEERIALLNTFGIGAIVIKKHLVSPVDEEITNLGVYPVSFVSEIDTDQRFEKVYENEGFLIYATPPSSD